MKSETLVYLISAMPPRINELISRLPQQEPGVDYLICCQTLGDCDIASRLSERADIRLWVMQELGLTKSRNSLLRTFFKDYSESYAVIADDDVEFLSVSYEDIKEIFSSTQATLVTGRVLTPNGSYFKNYKNDSFVHSSRTSNGVSSIEMIVSSELSNSKVYFDEKFGLGSTYKMGEEAIFIGDLIKKGYRVAYFPIDLFMHPNESTGSELDREWFLAKAALYARKYGKVTGAVLLLRRLFKLTMSRQVNFRNIIACLKCFIVFK